MTKMEERRPRIGEVVIKCRCGGRMRAGCSMPSYTYYYCRECGQSRKVARPAKP